MINSLRQVIGILLQALIQPRQLAQASLCDAQLIHGWLVIITANVRTFDRPVHQLAVFAQVLGIAQHLALLFQFLYFAWTQFGSLDLVDLKTQELRPAALVAFGLLQRLQRFACVAPLRHFRAQLRTQRQQLRVAVQEVNVLVRTQQAHMFALPVDIHQPACHLLQHLLRECAPIDARNGASRRAENVA